MGRTKDCYREMGRTKDCWLRNRLCKVPVSVSHNTRTGPQPREMKQGMSEDVWSTYSDGTNGLTNGGTNGTMLSSSGFPTDGS